LREKEGSTCRAQPAVTTGAERTSIVTWLPPSFVYCASACCSTLARSTTVPSFVAPLTTALPTVSAGFALSWDTATTSAGAPCGWQWFPAPYGLRRRVNGGIAVTIPRRGAQACVPATAPASRGFAAGTERWYRRRLPPPPPKIRWTRLEAPPSCAWWPYGER